MSFDFEEEIGDPAYAGAGGEQIMAISYAMSQNI
jgi:hypothetical protein